MEMVYRGILERCHGQNTFINENNSPEWKSAGMKYNLVKNWEWLLKRMFDIDKSNVRLTFMFDGAPIKTWNWRGAIAEDFSESADWEYYRSELRRIIRESMNQCRPITLLFNSGLHDLYSNKNLTDDNLYEKNLGKSMMYLKSMIYNEKSKRLSAQTCPDSVIETQFFWVNTVPPLYDRICHGGAVRYLNQIAVSTARQYNFHVLDAHSLLTGQPTYLLMVHMLTICNKVT